MFSSCQASEPVHGSHHRRLALQPKFVQDKII